MSLDPGLVALLSRRLSTLDDGAALGVRLVGDARRLWRRIQHFSAIGFVTSAVDAPALELACYALQLPARPSRALLAGKLARTSLRDRCEQSAELMVTLLADHADESLLDHAARCLHQAPHRSPLIDEARLLADAVNLDDFGIVGLMSHMIQLALQGEGPAELAAAMEKREQYGYWDARLKESFHFQPVAAIARRRLQQARKTAAILAAELAEDHPNTSPAESK